MPLIVIVLLDQFAKTPVGNPVADPIPVAPVVVIVILGEIATPTHTVGVDDGALTVVAVL